MPHKEDIDVKYARSSDIHNEGVRIFDAFRKIRAKVIKKKMLEV